MKHIKRFALLLFCMMLPFALVGCGAHEVPSPQSSAAGSASSGSGQEAPSAAPQPTTQAPVEPEPDASGSGSGSGGGGGYDYSSFSILGKWKSTGDWGVGQAQPGAIVIFEENSCNLYSPNDTYALYQEGSTLRLDATGMLGGTLHCTVVVVDNDHIELHTGGGDITYLQRVG